MREVAFLKENADEWKRFEQLIDKDSDVNADEIADLYIRLTDDLAWAQTFYPKSKTTAYLNQLTSRVHQNIYKNKKEDSSRFRQFWKTELPELYYRHRKKLLAAGLLFLFSVLVGLISSANDPMFSRMIMGDHYVNITISNIRKNDPLAVYKSQQSLDMFLGITFNNIRVSFVAFISGLLASIGTAAALLYNGIMVGAFISLFSDYHLVFKSISVIMIHGTLELSAITIAGAAGFTMGSGILFPGSFSRLESFKKSAKDGLKMTVGLVPIFIVAGFLESFVTRLTAMPVIINLCIIGTSLLFVIWYFIYYPRYISNKNKT